MKRIIMIMAACLICVNAHAEDLKIAWSVESGNSIDWDALARGDKDAPILLAQVAAPTGPGVVTPATPGTLGAGVDLAAKKGESTKLTGKQWLAIIGGALVAGRVVYHNRDKLGLGSNGSDNKPSSADASFNQANTDNTHSQCDFRGATIGDGAVIDCHDSSSRE